MKMSRKGALALICEEAIVLEAYQDQAKVWTIGIGHTAAAGGIVPKKGMSIILGEALALFRRDLAVYEAAVNRAIKVPLKQHEFDALVSFHYNTGAISSGSVDEKINAGRVTEALATMLTYKKIKGKDSGALANRRAREVAIFKNAAYRKDPVLVFDKFPKGPKWLVAQDKLWPEDAPAPTPKPAPAPPPPDVEPIPPVSVPPKKRVTAGQVIAGIIMAALAAAFAWGMSLIGGG